MRIGIDARFYGPIGGGGLGRYIKEVIDNLELIDHKNEYIVFLRRENWEDYKPRNPNFRKVLAPFRWYSWGEQIMMPIIIWKERVDLMHFPHFNFPLFYFGDFVMTIHDLILFKFPSKKSTTLSPLYFKFKYLIYKLVIWRALKKSRKIIVPSEFVKRDILAHFKISNDKIIVIYEGVTRIDRINSFGANESLKTVDKEADKIYKIGYNKNGEIDFLNDNYILYVGNAYPHKNLEKFIDAFSLVLKNNDFSKLKLVLVGVKNYFYCRVMKYVNNSHSQIAKNIIFWGYAMDKELESLYKYAKIYVFPSLEEGFGLPPLEAMSYGVPVVSSNSSCLPEILGDAVSYFNANDVNNMAKKIMEILLDEKLRNELIKKGYQRIKLFDWKNNAMETLKIYKSYSLKI